jgi:hypothetical protein
MDVSGSGKVAFSGLDHLALELALVFLLGDAG